jgi:hypothetical protein
MSNELENAMEQHNRLYQMAYREYLNNDLVAAHQLATEALHKAHEFYLHPDRPAEPERFHCRAATLLTAIEWRSLLVQDE